MEDQMYYLRIRCKKRLGVLVQLTHALEAGDFHIMHANITSVNDHIISSFTIEVLAYKLHYCI